MTRVHAADGELLAEYAKQRRLYLPIQAVPKLVINAFISAEDKNFYEHPGHRFQRHRARRHGLSAELRQGPASAGRLHHHPAGRQELPADQRGVVRPQDQGGAARAQDRAHLQQGKDPRALPQRNLSRLRRLRRRRRLAALFRQVGERTHHRGGGLSGRASQGADRPAPVPQSRSRDRAAQLRHRAAGRERLHRRRCRREGEEGAAHRHPARDRRAHLRRRLFRRGRAPRNSRKIRREAAL